MTFTDLDVTNTLTVCVTQIFRFCYQTDKYEYLFIYAEVGWAGHSSQLWAQNFPPTCQSLRCDADVCHDSSGLLFVTVPLEGDSTS